MVRRGKKPVPVPELCPNSKSGCLLQFKNKEKLSEHSIKCIYRQVICEGCGKQELFKNLTYHQKITQCIENKLKIEVANARKSISMQVRNHQRALKIERVTLENNLTRSFRKRMHDRYGSTPRVPQLTPRPSQNKTEEDAGAKKTLGRPIQYSLVQMHRCSNGYRLTRTFTYLHTLYT